MGTAEERVSIGLIAGPARMIVAAAVLAFCVAGVVRCGTAHAFQGISNFTIKPNGTQAGGHPDFDMSMRFDNRLIDNGEGRDALEPPPPGCQCRDARRIKLSLPTGFVGFPTAVPVCNLDDFSNLRCPSESQVGIAVFYLGAYSKGETSGVGQQPIFNVQPHPGEPVLLGTNVPLLRSPVFLNFHARTESDYGLDVSSEDIFHLFPLSGVAFHMWGVPGLAVHDVNRTPSPQASCFTEYPEPCGKPVPFRGPIHPFMLNPTSCGTPLTAFTEVLYYEGTRVSATSPWPATSGCDLLSFSPSLVAEPTTTEAETATGLDVDIRVPQPQDPFTPSPSEIKALSTTLPEGFSINSAGADGKQVCTEAQAAFGTPDAAHCPEHAKVGTLTIDSAALPGPIDGAIYIGEPKPDERYRLFLTASGFSTNVKLAATVKADAETGQLKVTSVDLPQSPLSRFTMHFFGSERGLLTTPAHCGTFPVETEFVPWDSALAVQRSVSHFVVDSGPGGGPCPPSPRSFGPKLQAGNLDNTAGRFSPFALRISRRDGDQFFSGLTVSTPPGFTASLRGIPYCPENALTLLTDSARSGATEQAEPACPAASRVGTVLAGIGAGTHTFYAAGDVYLAGPHRGAPLSLQTVIPAVEGPYDLGTVAVRVAVFVDPRSAQVTAVSDALPQVIEGVPIRVRSIQMDLDRSNFTLNPTSCNPFVIQSVLRGSEGGSSTLGEHFQVANCGDLQMEPKLKMRFSGSMNRTGDPGLHATLTTGDGEANIRRAVVTLPGSLILDNGHIKAPCTRAQYTASACPASSLLGSARATSPLLDDPLRGPVYLLASRHKLPDLGISLRGQVNIQLRTRISSARGRLRGNFEGLPDVPLKRFDLNLLGGKKGLISNTENLCKTKQLAGALFKGHNARRSRASVVVRTSCGRSTNHKRRSHRSARVRFARRVGR